MSQKLDSKILKIIESQGVRATISPDQGVVAIPCTLGGGEVSVDIYFAKGNFQINIGEMAVVDKIEGQDIDPSDIEDLLIDFLVKLRAGRIKVSKSMLLGIKAYSIETSRNPRHEQYESLGNSFVKKFGRKSVLGTLLPSTQDRPGQL